MHLGVLRGQRITCCLVQHVVHRHAVAFVHEDNFTQGTLGDTRSCGGSSTTVGQLSHIHSVVRSFLLGLGVNLAPVLAHLVEFQLVGRDQSNLTVHALGMVKHEAGCGVDLGQQVVALIDIQNVVHLGAVQLPTCGGYPHQSFEVLEVRVLGEVVVVHRGERTDLDFLLTLVGRHQHLDFTVKPTTRKDTCGPTQSNRRYTVAIFATQIWHDNQRNLGHVNQCGRHVEAQRHVEAERCCQLGPLWDVRTDGVVDTLVQLVHVLDGFFLVALATHIVFHVGAELLELGTVFHVGQLTCEAVRLGAQCTNRIVLEAQRTLTTTERLRERSLRQRIQEQAHDFIGYLGVNLVGLHRTQDAVDERRGWGLAVVNLAQVGKLLDVFSLGRLVSLQLFDGLIALVRSLVCLDVELLVAVAWINRRVRQPVFAGAGQREVRLNVAGCKQALIDFSLNFVGGISVIDRRINTGVQHRLHILVHLLVRVTHLVVDRLPLCTKFGPPGLQGIPLLELLSVLGVFATWLGRIDLLQCAGVDHIVEGVHKVRVALGPRLDALDHRLDSLVAFVFRACTFPNEDIQLGRHGDVLLGYLNQRVQGQCATNNVLYRVWYRACKELMDASLPRIVDTGRARRPCAHTIQNIFTFAEQRGQRERRTATALGCGGQNLVDQHIGSVQRSAGTLGVHTQHAANEVADCGEETLEGRDRLTLGVDCGQLGLELWVGERLGHKLIQRPRTVCSVQRILDVVVQLGKLFGQRM